MPPRRYSRYSLTTAVTDERGRLYLTERVPFRYRSRADTREYTVRPGDTLYTIAARQYAGLERPAGLWWVIADFQPQPIVDPTVQLVAGQLLFLPSLRVVQEEIFSERRRGEVDV
jgi:Tfp pilus assembly protein FimV